MFTKKILSSRFADNAAFLFHVFHMFTSSIVLDSFSCSTISDFQIYVFFFRYFIRSKCLVVWCSESDQLDVKICHMFLISDSHISNFQFFEAAYFLLSKCSDFTISQMLSNLHIFSFRISEILNIQIFQNWIACFRTYFKMFQAWMLSSFPNCYVSIFKLKFT